MPFTADARKLVLLAATSVVAIGAAAAPAQATPVTLDASCVLPFAKAQPAKVTVDVDYPAVVAANASTPAQPITTTVSYQGNASLAFSVIGARRVSGVHKVGLTFTAPGQTLPRTVAQPFAQTDIFPDDLPTVDLTGTGSTPALAFNPGTVQVKATSLTSTLTAYDDTGIIQIGENAGAEDGDPNTVTVVCTLAAGQNTTVETFVSALPAAVPTITSILPRTVKANRKSTVLITGTKLKPATSVKVGGVAATFTALTPTTLTATVPALPAGSYPVVITTPGGVTASTAQSTIKYVN